VATETGFNPIPVLIHLVAIAVGLYLGWLVMERITPDLPDDDTAPGLSSSTAPRAVAPDDPDSLLHASNLMAALAALDDQLAAGQEIVTLHLTPGSLETDAATADDGFAPDDVDPTLPQRLVDEIHAMRSAVTLSDVGYMDLVATRDGRRWYVQLDISRTDVSPPWTYGAPLEGQPVTAGGAPPKPIEG
jgi:hypothetical protein